MEIVKKNKVKRHRALFGVDVLERILVNDVNVRVRLTDKILTDSLHLIPKITWRGFVTFSQVSESSNIFFDF